MQKTVVVKHQDTIHPTPQHAGERTVTMNSDDQTSTQFSRRALLMSAAGMAASLAAISHASAQQAVSAPRIIRFSDHEPLGGMRTRFLKDVVFPAIEVESGGRLKIEDHWNGDIAKAYDALGAVGGGADTDMATVVPEYTAKELPLHQLFKSFPYGPSGERQVEFFRQVYNEVPEFTAELARNDIVPLFFGTGYPVAFFSTAPMADLAELKGGKWRSASFWHLDFLKNVGATPVTMHWGPEVPAALKAGTLDGLMVNVDSGYMLKVHDVAPNVLVSKDLWLGHLYLLTMQRSVWDSLDQQDRDAIVRAAEKCYEQLGSVMDASLQEQIEDLKTAGATVRVLTAEEAERFADATKFAAVQTAWADAQGQEGNGNASPTLAKVRAVMDRAME